MQSTTYQLTLARAAALARAGDLPAAEALLQTGGKQPPDTATLDLAARLRAQQGDYAAAESLWKQVLKTDPGNPAALAGLGRIQRSRSTGIVQRLILPAAVLLAAWLISSASVRASRSRASEAEQLRGALAAQGETTAAKLESLRLQLQHSAEFSAKRLEETRKALEQNSATALAAFAKSTQAYQSELIMRMDTLSGKLTQLEELPRTAEQLLKSDATQAAALEKLDAAHSQFTTAANASFQSLTHSLNALQDKLNALEALKPKTENPQPPAPEQKAGKAGQ